MTTTNVNYTFTDTSIVVEHVNFQTKTVDSISTYIPTGEEFINLTPEEQNKYEMISFALFSSEPDFLNE